MQKLLYLSFFIICFGVINNSTVSAQPTSQSPTITTNKIQEVTIQSSLRCGMCEATIQKALKGVPGVKSFKVNLLQNSIWIKYKTDKTSVETIRNAIAKVGYDADGIKANPEAYQKLPSCCKKP